MNPTTQPASPPRSDAGAAPDTDVNPRENAAASNTDTPATPGADKVARGNTRTTQNGESLPRNPNERDQTAGGAGTQEPRDDRTRDDPVGIGKRAHDDAVGDTQDTSLAPVTDKVYNDKVRP